VAHSPPNFAAAQSSLGVAPGPVVTATFVQQPIFNQVNGIMNMVRPSSVPSFTSALYSAISLVLFSCPAQKVFAYGGAMIFPEIVCTFFLFCSESNPLVGLTQLCRADGGNEETDGFLEGHGEVYPPLDWILLTSLTCALRLRPVHRVSSFAHICYMGFLCTACKASSLFLWLIRACLSTAGRYATVPPKSLPEIRLD
jgi:hypothetical protein